MNAQARYTPNFGTIAEALNWYAKSGVVDWKWFAGFGESELAEYMFRHSDGIKSVDMLLAGFLLANGQRPSDYSLVAAQTNIDPSEIGRENVLAVIVDFPRTARGVAKALTGDTTSEACRAAHHEISVLVEEGLCEWRKIWTGPGDKTARYAKLTAVEA